MPVNQLNRDLNDMFETYFPKKGMVHRVILSLLGRTAEAAMSLRSRLGGGQRLTNERIVEYAQVLKWVQPGGCVLDVGCVSSRLPIQLASMGYEVHGLDTRPYPFQHPGLTFHQADVFQWEPDRRFDIVLLISVMEHFGLGDYGDQIVSDADATALGRIREWMNPGAQLLLSVPYGEGAITPKHRIYNAQALDALLAGYERVQEQYFQRTGSHWAPCTKTDLEQVSSPGMPPNGVAILDLRVK